MAQKSKSKLRSVVYEKFRGMDVGACYKKTDSFRNVENFRVLADGSLKKRDGYKTIISQYRNIRAIWGGYIGKEFACYVLITEIVYKLDLNSAELTRCGTVLTNLSHAEFFYIHDRLYLKDAQGFYSIVGTTVTALGGYVPLLGKDWGTGYPGEINEHLNLLHRHARITYKVGESVSAYLPTLYPVASVEALYKNGEVVANENYSIDARFNTINMSGLNTGDSLEVHLTFAEEESDERAQIKEFCNCGVFGGIMTSRIFLWGDNSSKIFHSRRVSEKEAALSESAYPQSGSLYFTKEDSFTVGNGKYPVRSIIRHYDRLLIFTSGDAWMANEEVSGAEEFPAMRINTNTGLNTRSGSASAGNDPITVGKHAIYRWNSNTDELNDCSAYRISEPISQALGKEFFDRAIAHESIKHGEIWFSDPEGDGSVWVYDYVKNYWTRFTNIFAEAFFDADGEVGFISEGKICAFSDELSSDYKLPGLSLQTTVYGRLKSAYCDYGDEDVKKLCSICCRADLDNSTLFISFMSDRNRSTSLELGPKEGYALMIKRLKAQRLRGFYFDLTAGGDSRQRIFSLEVKAR